MDSTLLGVLIGALIGIFSIRFTDWLRDGRIRKRLAIALHAEMVAIRDRYMKVFGNKIAEWDPDTQPFVLSGRPLVSSQHFFSVYEGNTANWGNPSAERGVLL